MKNLLFSLLTIFLFTSPAQAEFSDVNENTMYHGAIEYLVEKDIINGYQDGTFKPEGTLNRAELLKILIEATVDTELDTSQHQNCFPDVRDEWFAKYVCYAKEQGVVNGYQDGMFRPEQTISFVEVAKIIVSAMDLEVGEATDVWFENYVKALTENKRVPRTITSFDHLLQRGEMAEIVWREVKHVEKREDWISYLGILLNIPKEQISGWKNFESTNFNFKLQYPAEMLLKENENNIFLYHKIDDEVFINGWICSRYLADNLIDFGWGIEVFHGSLEEAIDHIDPAIKESVFENNSIQQNTYTTDYFMTEGCGFFITFYVIDSKNVLISKDYSIFGLTSMTATEKEDYLNQNPTLITPEENRKLKSKILSTLLLLGE